jgi:hypothetical protein
VNHLASGMMGSAGEIRMKLRVARLVLATLTLAEMPVRVLWKPSRYDSTDSTGWWAATREFLHATHSEL